jgi:hypothetical protein
MKIVVFDLDETLGYFVELGIFIDCLKRYIFKFNKNLLLTQNDFNDIINLYPEFLRPNIIDILSFLKNKKENNKCNKIMIYTNNQGHKKWVESIVKYFEDKINYKLFDQIIAAFKINGEIIEPSRTSHNKSFKDLVRCTKIPVNAEICFLDDNYFPGMNHKSIFYINITPYVYNLDFNVLCNRFINSNIGKKVIHDKEEFRIFMENEFAFYKFKIFEKSNEEYNIDKILSKQILLHLHEFFNKSIKNKTTVNRSKIHKSKINNHNKTKKYY